MATQFLDMSDVRQRLSELLGKLTDPIYITVYDKPSAVIIGYETYEGMLARMEDLEDSLDVLLRKDAPTVDFETVVREMDTDYASPRKSGCT